MVRADPPPPLGAANIRALYVLCSSPPPVNLGKYAGLVPGPGQQMSVAGWSMVAQGDLPSLVTWLMHAGTHWHGTQLKRSDDFTAHS